MPALLYPNFAQAEKVPKNFIWWKPVTSSCLTALVAMMPPIWPVFKTCIQGVSITLTFLWMHVDSDILQCRILSNPLGHPKLILASTLCTEAGLQGIQVGNILAARIITRKREPAHVAQGSGCCPCREGVSHWFHFCMYILY